MATRRLSSTFLCNIQERLKPLEIPIASAGQHRDGLVLGEESEDKIDSPREFTPLM